MKNGYWLCGPIIFMAFALGWFWHGEIIYHGLAADKSIVTAEKEMFYDPSTKGTTP